MAKTIRASEGHILTNGTVYGSVIYLAEGMDGADFCEITLGEYNAVLEGEDAAEEDYRAALKEMGVRI
jgi:hypothetical protein